MQNFNFKRVKNYSGSTINLKDQLNQTEKKLFDYKIELGQLVFNTELMKLEKIIWKTVLRMSCRLLTYPG